ncbi:TPA: hypothetical protein HA265_06260 [Candidatus Woesearchaeota archaeon]|nr:hypothetical protein [Candidatus Woesearchaeota archaeon]
MRKAQVWYTDFMIGILIFALVTVAYFYYVEHNDTTDNNLDNYLMTEAKSISNYLVTEGYPTDWTPTNVSTIGLTDGNHRVQDAKLADFNSWTYDQRKSNMHTTKEHYFYLEYLNGTRFNELCSDMPGCNEWNTSDHLVQNTRLLIYNSKIVRMKLYMYQKP